MSSALQSHSIFNHAIFLFWNPQHIPCSVTGTGDPSEHMFVSHNNTPKQSFCKIWQNLKRLLNLTRIQSIPNGWKWSNYSPLHIFTGSSSSEFLTQNPQHIPGSCFFKQHSLIQNLCKMEQNLKEVKKDKENFIASPTVKQWPNYGPKNIHNQIFLNSLNPKSTPLSLFMIVSHNTVFYKTSAKWVRISKEQKNFKASQLVKDDPIIDPTTFTSSSSLNSRNPKVTTIHLFMFVSHNTVSKEYITDPQPHW